MNAGAARAPRTRAHLLEALRNGGFTLVLVFCHGWKNDLEVASELYSKLGHHLSIPGD
jgi:hypothetical protein